MKLPRFFPLCGLLMSPTLWAVYAPIPEQEQGKDLSVLISAGLSHDSNIFGSASGEIDSMVYSVSPQVKLNSSLSDQTFFTGFYKLRIDHFTDRPGEKTLDSHDLSARLAHAFTAASNIDLSDTYTISKNPESLLAGVPINTDQSFKRNQFDSRFVTGMGPKGSGTVKFRTVDYRYDNTTLADSIDRTENLYGAEFSYAVLPEIKAVAEYRRQDINYRTAGSVKDKQSNFLIGGLDYNVARKLTATGRLGYEWRHRDGEQNSEAPYVELSLKYDYAEKSYVTAGSVYTFEETSDVANYNDTEVSRLFINIQHSVSALVVASCSVTYEMSTLQGRRGVVDADETTTRFGAALTYLMNKNWALAVTFDHDKVSSDLASRDLSRNRFGLNATYSF